MSTKAKRPTAYLLGLLDITATPPVMRSAAVMSHDTPVVELDRHRHRWLTLSVGYGNDFTEGVEHLRRQCMERPDLRWVLPLLGEDDRLSLFNVETVKVERRLCKVGDTVLVEGYTAVVEQVRGSRCRVRLMFTTRAAWVDRKDCVIQVRGEG